MTASRAYIHQRSGGTWYRKAIARAAGTLPPDPEPPGEWVAPQYTAGSLPVGEASYTIPSSNVLYVSTTGNDSNGGTTTGAPLATLSAAIDKVTVAGTTIVVRAGTYHQGNIEASVSKPAFTIQNYPGEAVWFDGATVFNATWTQNGAVWTAPYTITNDRNLGKSAERFAFWTGSNFRSVVDQVWLDDVKLLPAADNTTPGPGYFSINQATDTLTIGTSPVGKTVRIVDLQYLIAGGAITMRGIGVRRYAPNQIEWRQAAVMLGANCLMENCVIEHISLDAMAFAGANGVVRKSTFQDTGHGGVMSDDIAHGIIELNILRRINRLQYDPEPTTSAIKVTRVFEGVTIRHNHISDVFDGKGVWFDTTVSRSVVANNTILGTSAISGGQMKSGITIEGSDGGFYDGVQYYTYIVGNRVSGCRISGISLSDNGWIKVYNNYASTGVCYYAWQDYRENKGTMPSTEGTILQSPWHCRDLYLINNIAVPAAPYNTQLRAQVNSDAAYKTTGGAMWSAIRGNWFRPQGGGLFGYIYDVNGNPTITSTLTALANLSPTYGGPLASIMANNVQQDATPPDSIADPLPAEVAVPYGVPVGIQKVGPIIPAPLLSM